MAKTTSEFQIEAKDKVLSEMRKIEKGVRKTFKGMQKQAKQTNDNFGQLKAGVVSLVSAIGAREIVRFGAHLAEVGGRASAVGDAFERLNKTIGESAEAMLHAAQRGSARTISDYDLMLAANKAIMLELPITAKEMEGLADVARSLGTAMGQDAAKSMDDLIVGLSRGSAKILDNIGIVLNETAAMRAYANEIGKTTDALSDAEKKQAVLNATMRTASVISQALNTSTENFQTSTGRLSASWENLKAAFGGAISESRILNGVMNSLANSFNEMATKEKGEELKEFFRESAQHAAALSGHMGGALAMQAAMRQESDRQRNANNVQRRMLPGEASDAFNATNAMTLDALGKMLRTTIDDAYAARDAVRSEAVANLAANPPGATGIGMFGTPMAGGRMQEIENELKYSEVMATSNQRIHEQIQALQLLSVARGEQINWNEQTRISQEMLNAAHNKERQAMLTKANQAVSAAGAVAAGFIKGDKAQAAVERVMALAHAAFALASQNYAAAAQYFTSAMLFGRVSGGGGGGGASSGATSSYSPFQAPSGSQQQPPIVINNNIDYDSIDTRMGGIATKTIVHDFTRGGDATNALRNNARHI